MNIKKINFCAAYSVQKGAPRGARRIYSLYSKRRNLIAKTELYLIGKRICGNNVYITEKESSI